jgi:serine/threonine protein kinase
MMLVMEFLEKGPVLQTHDQAGFDCLPEEVAADYFRQAVAGLEYLHFHKVCDDRFRKNSERAIL